MRRTTRPAAPRGGFTLIELLVAAALSLVVMTVLSLAFQTGLQTLSSLKSVIGLAEQMRAAEGVFRRDLTATHLEDSLGQPVRVSQLAGGERGYFRFTQGESLAVTPEGPGPHSEGGIGSDGPVSFRTPSAARTVLTTPLNNALSGRAWGDCLSLTVKLKGTGPQEVFTASLGSTPAIAQNNLALLTAAGATRPELQAVDSTGTLFVSQWAEVAYFLIPSNTRGGEAVKAFTSDEGMPAGSQQLPLYTLYRRQRALAPQTVTPTTALTGSLPGLATTSAGIVVGPDTINTPDSVAGFPPLRRVAGKEDPIALLATNPPSPPPQAPQLLAINALPAAVQADQQGRPHSIPNLVASTVDPGPSREFGSDVLLNNVVSMTVRPLFVFTTPPEILAAAAGPPLLTIVSPVSQTDYLPRDFFPQPANLMNGITAGEYDLTTNYPRRFDTAVGNGVPLRYTVGGNPQIGTVTGREFKLKAIEIKLRVYDAKNKTTRQMTVLQDL